MSGKEDLQQLLVELASALIPLSITPSMFSKLARAAFVRAAADRSRLRNGRINHSKVAALTGLPRKEIARILKWPARSDGDLKTLTPTERVLQGWLTDRRFLSRQGRPKSLTTFGRAPSFVRLVKEYGGDISPRAVLEELVASRIVCGAGRHVELRSSKLPKPRTDLGSLARVIPTLVDSLRIASSHPAIPIDSYLYRLSLYADTEAELALIRQRCLSSIQSLLSGLKDSLDRQVTIPLRKRSSRHALGVTVLLADAGVGRR